MVQENPSCFFFPLSPWKPFRSISETVQFHSKPLLWKESKVNPTFSLLTSSLNVNVRSFVNQGLSDYLLLHMQNQTFLLQREKSQGKMAQLPKQPVSSSVFSSEWHFSLHENTFSFFSPHSFKRFQRLLNRIDSNIYYIYIYKLYIYTFIYIYKKIYTHTHTYI